MKLNSNTLTRITQGSGNLDLNLGSLALQSVSLITAVLTKNIPSFLGYVFYTPICYIAGKNNGRERLWTQISLASVLKNQVLLPPLCTQSHKGTMGLPGVRQTRTYCNLRYTTFLYWTIVSPGNSSCLSKSLTKEVI